MSENPILTGLKTKNSIIVVITAIVAALGGGVGGTTLLGPPPDSEALTLAKERIDKLEKRELYLVGELGSCRNGFEAEIQVGEDEKPTFSLKKVFGG